MSSAVRSRRADSAPDSEEKQIKGKFWRPALPDDDPRPPDDPAPIGILSRLCRIIGRLIYVIVMAGIAAWVVRKYGLLATSGIGSTCVLQYSHKIVC